MFPRFDLLKPDAPDLVFQMREKPHETERRPSWSGVAFIRNPDGEWSEVESLTDADHRGSFQWVHSVWHHWPELEASCYHEFEEGDWGITLVNRSTFEEFVELLQGYGIPLVSE